MSFNGINFLYCYSVLHFNRGLLYPPAIICYIIQGHLMDIRFNLCKRFQNKLRPSNVQIMMKFFSLNMFMTKGKYS